jgi:hypothetical protein
MDARVLPGGQVVGRNDPRFYGPPDKGPVMGQGGPAVHPVGYKPSMPSSWNEGSPIYTDDEYIGGKPIGGVVGGPSPFMDYFANGEWGAGGNPSAPPMQMGSSGNDPWSMLRNSMYSPWRNMAGSIGSFVANSRGPLGMPKGGNGSPMPAGANPAASAAQMAYRGVRGPGTMAPAVMPGKPVMTKPALYGDFGPSTTNPYTQDGNAHNYGAPAQVNFNHGAPTNVQEAYQQSLTDYASPQYRQYYESLAPSTRAFVHAPDDPATGRYLAEQAASNFAAFNGNNGFDWALQR